jgi:hypothetical protein
MGQLEPLGVKKKWYNPNKTKYQVSCFMFQRGEPRAQQWLQFSSFLLPNNVFNTIGVGEKTKIIRNVIEVFFKQFFSK